MRTLDEVIDQFVYHPATKETAGRHSALRDLFVQFSVDLWDLVPGGPEKTIVFRKIQEALMYAQLGVAMTSPADTSPTRKVARVLPADLPGPVSVTVDPTTDPERVAEELAYRLRITRRGASDL